MVNRRRTKKYNRRKSSRSSLRRSLRKSLKRKNSKRKSRIKKRTCKIKQRGGENLGELLPSVEGSIYLHLNTDNFNVVGESETENMGEKIGKLLIFKGKEIGSGISIAMDCVT